MTRTEILEFIKEEMLKYTKRGFTKDLCNLGEINRVTNTKRDLDFIRFESGESTERALYKLYKRGVAVVGYPIVEIDGTAYGLNQFRLIVADEDLSTSVLIYKGEEVHRNGTLIVNIRETASGLMYEIKNYSSDLIVFEA